MRPPTNAHLVPLEIGRTNSASALGVQPLPFSQPAPFSIPPLASPYGMPGCPPTGLQSTYSGMPPTGPPGAAFMASGLGGGSQFYVQHAHAGGGGPIPSAPGGAAGNGGLPPYLAAPPSRQGAGSPLCVPFIGVGPVGMAQHHQQRSSSASTLSRTNLLSATGTGAGVSEADSIKVAIRVRPLFPKDKEGGATSVLQVSEDHSTLKVVVGGPAGTTMSRDFQFHACLGPGVSQQDVLHLCGVPQLLEAALAGYNVTIFAYGQTGSGKTYTMSGREEVIKEESYDGDAAHDGIVTRAVGHLFDAIAKKRGEAKFTLSASYLEIYNEQICDLLNLKQKNMAVKWDAAQGFYVPGLRTVACTNIKKMHEVLSCGMKHRHVGSHELNMESSRSHSMLTILCQSQPLDTVNEGPRQGKISFVDLAGSERLKDSRSDGCMLKETANINKSLFVLGKVISALADKETSGTAAHIPYRDSKLTKLLMDSLGGSSLALMIACCSPSSNHVEETLSTLTYATRAKNIQNRPTVQFDPREAQMVALRREIDLLRQENSYLRDQVRLGGSPATATPVGPLGALHLNDTRPPRCPAAEDGSPPSHDASGSSIGGSSATKAAMSGPDAAAAAGAEQQPAQQLWGHLGAGSTGSGDVLPLGDDCGGSDGGGGSGERLGGPLLVPHMFQGSASFNTTSLRGSTNLEPLRASLAEMFDSSGGVGRGSPVVERGGTPGSYGGGGSGGGRLLSAVAAPDPSSELLRRLKDTQSLLSRFSEENGRLAKENDKLRSTRQVLSNEHADVLDEIDALRGKLNLLQTSVAAGSHTPSDLRHLLGSFRTHSSGGSSTISPQLPTAGAALARSTLSTGTAAPSAPAPTVNLNAVLSALNAVPSSRAPTSAAGQPHQPTPPGLPMSAGSAGASSLAPQLYSALQGGCSIRAREGTSAGAPSALDILAAIPATTEQPLHYSLSLPSPSRQPPAVRVLGRGAVQSPAATSSAGGTWDQGTSSSAEGAMSRPSSKSCHEQDDGTQGGAIISMGPLYSALLHSAPQDEASSSPHGLSASTQQQYYPLQPPVQSPGSGGGHRGGVTVANVMSLGVPGAGGESNSSAMRTRGANGRQNVTSSGYGSASSTSRGAGGDDSIIVADRAKLSLLLGFGNVEDPQPLLRPVPIKPPPDQILYASPLKQKHQHEIQRHVGAEEWRGG